MQKKSASNKKAEQTTNSHQNWGANSLSIFALLISIYSIWVTNNLQKEKMQLDSQLAEQKRQFDSSLAEEKRQFDARQVEQEKKENRSNLVILPPKEVTSSNKTTLFVKNNGPQPARNTHLSIITFIKPKPNFSLKILSLGKKTLQIESIGGVIDYNIGPMRNDEMIQLDINSKNKAVMLSLGINVTADNSYPLSWVSDPKVQALIKNR